MHRDMQFAVHTGKWGGNASSPQGPRDSGCARCLGPGVSPRWCRGIASSCDPGGQGRGGAFTRGFSRAGAWGPGRGGGGCAWLGWRCSPLTRRRASLPPPHPLPPLLPRLLAPRPGARPLPGPARAGAASASAVTRPGARAAGSGRSGPEEPGLAAAALGDRGGCGASF